MQSNISEKEKEHIMKNIHNIEKETNDIREYIRKHKKKEIKTVLAEIFNKYGILLDKKFIKGIRNPRKRKKRERLIKRGDYLG